MTECPFIPSTEDRLAQPHRPNSLVRSDPTRRAKGAGPLRSELNLRQTLWWNRETAIFSPHSNASIEVTDPTESALSPKGPLNPRSFLPERFSNAGHSRAKSKDCTLACIRKSSS